MAISTNEIAQRLFKKLLGKGDTSTNRAFYEEAYNGSLQVFSNNIWTDTSKIPTVFLPTFRTLSGSTVQNLINDSYVYPDGTTGLTQSNAVVQVKTYELTKDNGSNATTPDSQGFAFVNPSATDIIPFTYGNPYSYYITYNSGSVLSFGSGDSVFDPESGILKFYTANIPSDWDGSSSFVIKAGKYIGNKLSSYDLSEINNKLSISTFTAYTATTKTQIDSKVDYSTFTGYTATTNTRINNKLNISTFTAYTATTKTQIDSKVDYSTYDTFVSTTNGSISTINNNTVFIPGNGLNSTIRCGLGNNAICDNSSILGGCNNQVSGVQSTIVGGQDNRIEAPSCYSFIGGGVGNFSEHENTFILGSSITTTTPDTTYVQGLNIKNGVYDGNSSLGDSGNILSSTGTGVRWGSTDNLISGSTSVISKLNISDFSSYSSNTNTLIGTKLNITTFNTYTSNTNTLINSGILFSSNTIGSTIRINNNNTISGNYSTISGGQGNTILIGSNSVIGGGVNNTTSSGNTFIGGGLRNSSIGAGSVVVGGYCNASLGVYSVIGGGFKNTITCSQSSGILGGQCNLLTAPDSVIGGGCLNIVTGLASFIGGGLCNNATGTNSSIGAGQCNSTGGDYSTVGGGFFNNSLGNCSTVGGGAGNNAVNTFSTVGGGCGNISRGTGSFVGGGQSNELALNSNYSSILGGISNCVDGQRSTVIGGTGNVAEGSYSTISGGLGNKICQSPKSGTTFTTILNGCSNTSCGYSNLLNNGISNLVSGNYNNVGGNSNITYGNSLSVNGTSNVVSNNIMSINTVVSNTNPFIPRNLLTVTGITYSPLSYWDQQVIDNNIFNYDSLLGYVTQRVDSNYSAVTSSAMFNVSRASSSPIVVTVNSSGNNFFVGDQITISGTTLGYESPKDDLIFYVDSVEFTPVPAKIFISGDKRSGYTAYDNIRFYNNSEDKTYVLQVNISGATYDIGTNLTTVCIVSNLNTNTGVSSSGLLTNISTLSTGTTSSIIGGGKFNIITNSCSIIGGGNNNTVSGDYSTILNGSCNRLLSCYSTILGGSCNFSCGVNSGILGNGNIVKDCNTYVVGSDITTDRNCTTFVNNLSIMNIPTNPTGLPSGSVWNNCGVLNIV